MLYEANRPDRKHVSKVITYLIAGVLCEEQSPSYRRALGQQIVARLKENAHFDTLWRTQEAQQVVKRLFIPLPECVDKINMKMMTTVCKKM